MQRDKFSAQPPASPLAPTSAASAKDMGNPATSLLDHTPEAPARTASLSPSHEDVMADVERLGATALRVRDERDDALDLLRDISPRLERWYRDGIEAGPAGRDRDFKSLQEDIRALLARVDAS